MCAVTICNVLQVSLLISQILLRYIGVCLNKHYSLKSIINCLISRTQLVRSGVECGGVRDVAEQQHCLQNY